MWQDHARPLSSLQRLRHRELFAGRSGSVVPGERAFFENVLPDAAAAEVEPPDCHVFKFTPSGQYLVCFGHLLQDLVVYRYTGREEAYKEEAEAAQPAVAALRFDRFFRLLYRTNLTQTSEALCRDCCLVLQTEEFVLVASSSAPISPEVDGTEPDTEVSGVPLTAATTLYLVHLRTGEPLDTYTIRDDFVHLGHNGGIHLFDDIIVVLAIRSQSIHVLQLRGSGSLLPVQVIGSRLRPDDALVLATAHEAEQQWQAARLQVSDSDHHQSHATASMYNAPPQAGHGRELAASDRQLAGMPRRGSEERLLTASSAARQHLPSSALAHAHAAAQDQHGGITSPAVASVTGIPMSEAADSHRARSQTPELGPPEPALPLLEGMRHAILAYVFRLRLQQASTDPGALTRFYSHFSYYCSLAMWKVQMIDANHLLLALGPQDAASARSSIESPSGGYIMAIYCISSAKIIGLLDSQSEALMTLYLRHALDFYAASVCCDWDRFITPSAAVPGSDNTQAARRGLAGMPAAAQLLTPSPYLDTRCWQYDSRHVTPLLRHRPYNEQPLRFASTTHPHEVKFKLQLPEPPAPPAQAPAGRQPKSMTVCHFHPSQPFVLCTLQTYGSAPQMCVYYRA